MFKVFTALSLMFEYFSSFMALSSLAFEEIVVVRKIIIFVVIIIRAVIIIRIIIVIRTVVVGAVSNICSTTTANHTKNRKKNQLKPSFHCHLLSIT